VVDKGQAEPKPLFLLGIDPKLLLPPLAHLITSERLGFELPLPQRFLQGPPASCLTR
jgi:hypothetical protein